MLLLVCLASTGNIFRPVISLVDQGEARDGEIFRGRGSRRPHSAHLLPPTLLLSGWMMMDLLTEQVSSFSRSPRPGPGWGSVGMGVCWLEKSC